MNIVYSSSDSYAPIAGVSMYSLLCNNRDAAEINIFMIDNRISEENKQKMRRMCDDFHRSIRFIPIADIEKLAGASIDIGRWNISTFSRLFYASLLPASVEKVIHVDCDTMVLSSLEPLWNTDIEGKIVAGALECIGDNYKTEVGLDPSDTYINAGNILLNLKKIREDGTEELFKRYIREHSQLSFVDQAVINACVKSSEKQVISLRYNLYSIVYYIDYKNLKYAKRVRTYYSEDELNEAKDNPCIVHFTSCFMDGTRPWMEHNAHPLVHQYLAYRKASPWGELPLWQDDRGKAKKASVKLFNALPQGLTARAVGVVHGIIIPAAHKFKK